ncbi:MAG: PilZ domain-containing protein [Planctomycetota bacterium]|nr:PilZ domain-containing protein [Planctomycetota bacterium]
MTTNDAAVMDPEANLSLDDGAERRRSERQVIVRPGKVFLRTALRYVPATTSNVSAGGALLCVDRSRPIRAGELVEIAIDWNQAAIVRQDELSPARVVRVTPMDCHHQAVAVAFERPASAALSQAA